MSYLIIDIAGTSLTQEDQELLLHPAVAGIILFARNFESPEQLKALTASIRRIRSPLIIAVDQEGGRVQRFLQGFTRLPSMHSWGEHYDHNPQQALLGLTQTIKIMSRELLNAGINVNLTPVLDVDHGKSAVIGERSFHSKPDHVTHLAQTVIAELHQNGMPAIGKHFPGHGAVVADSHLDLPVDEREWETIESMDLIPFVKLLAHLDAIMPAHILFQKLDPYPAGFSTFWLKDVLRRRLNFQGVVISDDLSMKGAACFGSYPQRVALALQAGCDLLLICNNRSGVEEALNVTMDRPDPFSEQRVTTFIQNLK